MNSINRVVSFIREQLMEEVNEPSDKSTIMDFLVEMKVANHSHGHRLLYSIAIDLKSGALPVSDIRNAVLQIPIKKEFLQRQLRSLPKGTNIPTLAAFGQVLKEMLKKSTAPTSVFQTTVPDPYVHVCTLSAFMKYLTRHKDFGEYDEDRKLEIRENFSIEHAEQMVTSFGPPNGLIYITHAESMLGTINQDDRAAHLADGLGLSPWDVKPGTELVVVRYPSDFDQVCYQPCCLNAYWGSIMVDHTTLQEGVCNPCYLSFSRFDGYGRTFSFSGKVATMRERVHRSFSGLTKGILMQAELLEPIRNPIQQAPFAQILKEGYRRYKSC